MTDSIPRPPDTQPCSGCNHPFGEHFSTYDKKATGCAHYDDDQRDGGPCYCKGFSMAWSPL